MPGRGESMCKAWSAQRVVEGAEEAESVGVAGQPPRLRKSQRHLPGERHRCVFQPLMALQRVLTSCRHHCLALSRLRAALHASQPAHRFPGCALGCDSSCPRQASEAGGSGTLFHPGVSLQGPTGQTCVSGHVAGRGRGGGEETGSRQGRGDEGGGEEEEQGSVAA